MENATKALLIAAAVLVVIVIIALGVRLLGSASDTSEDANAVSQALASSTDAQVTQITSGLSQLSGSNP